jgi:hypothetical protein
MSPANVQAEVDRDPFVPLRFHVASGKTFVVRHPNSAFPMGHAVVVLHRLRPGSSAIGGYDEINLRQIEKIEQLHDRRNGRSRKSA